MSSTSIRPRRVVPSTVNTPVAIKVLQDTSLDTSEAQLLLDQFLTNAESADLVINSSNNANISQLKRCQRELRGMTPLLQDNVQTTTAVVNTPNKKIKFDDEITDSVIPEEEEPVVGKKIDKEERKRLKKERRKEEKKRKLEEVV